MHLQFLRVEKKSENQRVKCFFIPFHIAHMLHTNLIPYRRCPVHILGKGKKIHFWKPKLVPIPVPGTIRPPEESDLISRQFPSKISARNTNASFANKVPITSYFIFSCFAAGGQFPPPLFDDFFLRDIFFPLERKKKMLTVEFCYGKWLGNFSFFATGKIISFAYSHFL